MKPRSAQPFGVIRVSRRSTAGADEIGMKFPPSSASTTPTADEYPPACSSVLAAVTTRVVMPIAASTAATTSRSTASGWPHLAPSSADDATTSTSMLVKPRTKLAMALPPSTARAEMGAAWRRASVAWRRSASRLLAPSPTVKKRKKIAIAGPKYEAGFSWRPPAAVSASVTTGGALVARPTSASACDAGTPAARALRTAS